MNPIDTQGRIAELEAITREYSRYESSAGGLSAVLGGAFCLLSFGLGLVGLPTPILLVALASLPILWLCSRHLLSRHYYQRCGQVVEHIDASRQRTQRALTLGVGVLVIIIAFGTWTDRGDTSALYYTALLLVPMAALLWLRTPIELVIGTVLLCQTALAATGRSFAALGPATLLLPAALLMIAIGWRDHRKFIRLQRRMRALTSTGSDV